MSEIFLIDRGNGAMIVNPTCMQLYSMDQYRLQGDNGVLAWLLLIMMTDITRPANSSDHSIVGMPGVWPTGEVPLSNTGQQAWRAGCHG